jgi:hypothetical protein
MTTIKRTTQQRKKENKKNNNNTNKNKEKNNNSNTINGKNKDNCIITVHSVKLRVISAVSQLLKQTQDAVLQEQLYNADCHQ